MNLLELVLQVGVVAKFTLILLGLISIGTWAVIFFKWRQMRKAESGLLTMAELVEESKNCVEFASNMRDFKETSGWRLARALLAETARLRSDGFFSDRSFVSASLIDVFIKRLSRRLTVVKERELLLLRSYLPFLAMAGNSSPFIGLFGTVWGIMSAFHHIGLRGSASLATVAPGIAEALVATAFGLFAAIPAASAYNLFTARLERLETRLQELGELVLLLVERDILRSMRFQKKQGQDKES